MRKATVGALIGIAVLGGGSLAGIVLVTMGDEPAGAPGAAALAEHRPAEAVRPGSRRGLGVAKAPAAVPLARPPTTPVFAQPAPLPAPPAPRAVPSPSAADVARLVAPEGPLTAVSRYHGGGRR